MTNTTAGEMPKDRAALIEVIAAELVNQYAVNYDVADMNASSMASFRTEANQILTALEAAGCVVVPNEATPQMVMSASAHFDGRKQGRFYDAYTAMLSASPYRP